jgi:DNA invertase Pin-like site-specific DNA recombinase
VSVFFKRDRPELNRMLEFLRAEDTVVVTDLTRLSRSTKDLIEITELILQKGAHLKSLKESWLDTKEHMEKCCLPFLLGLHSLSEILPLNGQRKAF